MYALEIENLCKTYLNGVEALKNINLKVEEGDFFALLGANGAGKSTTIGIIATLLTKSSGTVKVNGYDIDANPEKAKLSLGLVPQEYNLNIFETCTEILLNQAGYYGIMPSKAKDRANHLLRQLGLWNKRFSRVRHLSGGLKRRLMIARALVHKPKLLILDEPTAGVDIEIRRDVWNFLTRANKDGTTIILTTHYLEEAEHLCKNIAIIDHGEIIENTSIKALLRSINFQTFVFTTRKKLNYEELDLAPFTPIALDNYTFEVRVEGNCDLNKVFDVFDKNNLQIHSMRNKTNRLEEFFLERIKHGH